jgi:ketosteroid isomerase-like protein
MALDQASAISVLELQLLLANYWNELDGNGARNIESFYVEDCIFTAGAHYEFKGRAGVRKFYDDREKVVAEEKDGIRNCRHTSTNVRISLEGKDKARIDFVMINYSGGGKLPVHHFKGPSMVADITWKCRREADGEWRLESFVGRPVFIGDESFISKMIKD